MPNHISNKLVVTSKKPNEISRFLNEIKGTNLTNNKEEIIDFETIVRMPDCLKDTEESSKTNEAIFYYLNVSGKTDILSKVLSYSYLYKMERFNGYSEELLHEMYQIGEKYYNNYVSVGSTTWYEWRYKNWGTKWNAYNSYIQKKTKKQAIIFFQTAWCGVPSIIEKLVEKYPDIHFKYKYADEDMTYNCGEGDGDAENGFYFKRITGGSDEAMKTYIECWDEDEEDFIKHNGKWTRTEWLEDEEDEEENEEV